MQNFSPSAHWRDSSRNARFFIVDARAAFAILLFLVHIATWTAMLVVINLTFFAIVEHYGFTIPVFFRWLRTVLAGPVKLSQPWWIS